MSKLYRKLKEVPPNKQAQSSQMWKSKYLLSVILITLLSTNTLPAQGEVVLKNAEMRLIKTINGSITPKSVRSSGDVVVSALNMMYRHSITLYDAKTIELLKTVPDQFL